MKILCFAHSGDISGGANRSFLTVINGLKKKGHSLLIVLPRDNCEMTKVLKESGIEYISLKYYPISSVLMHDKNPIIRYIKLYGKFIRDYFMSFIYAKTLSSFSTDLIYTNTRLPYMGAFIAKRIKKPHVWHVREYSIDNGSIGLPNEYKLFDKLSNKIILISKDLYKEYAKYIEEDKLKCIYNGIPEEITKKDIDNNHIGFNILLTGRITETKGQLEAIQATNILIKKYDKIKLYLAGSAAHGYGEEYKKKIMNYIRNNNMEKHIVFLGEVKDMPLLRAKMDIELVCAKREAFGRVTVEALRSGLPVIGSCTGATPELIVPEYNGYLYNKGEYDELAKYIEKIVLDSQLKQKLSRNAKESMFGMFTVHENVEAIEQVLVESLNNNKSSREYNL